MEAKGKVWKPPAEVFPPTVDWKLDIYVEMKKFSLDGSQLKYQYTPKNKTYKQFLLNCVQEFELHCYPLKKKDATKQPEFCICRRTRALLPGSFHPDTNSWAPSEQTSEESASVPSLLVVSQNVLFGPTDGKEDPTYTKHRIPALLKELEKTDADVIALQEVEPPFYRMILEQEWVRKKYFVSDVKGHSCFPHGNLVLSKHAFESICIHNFKYKNCNLKNMLLATFKINNRRVSMGVVHLKAGVDYDMRKGEVEEAIELQQGEEDLFLIGDFNFREGGNEPIEDTPLKEAGYVDIWEALHPDNKNAVTYDIENNVIASIVSKMATERTGRTGKSFRYDRMYIKSKSWQAQSIEMIGKEPIPEITTFNKKPLFISDHYGLKTTLTTNLKK
eukprot:TRINITY_DN17158_c0_g1_i1.p1 TRINITY_DN17158_c0_g1~~TRINITY_DN17158_c0_g1_i1.p1  ORF type:complete len:389 (-),score=107.35 TRINITY_DN17158_c0_g1_i1:76-1242(-)